MTLILAVRGQDFLVLASDRRLTANGRLIDDASNKATIVTFPGGQLACGFTGLAAAGRFRTQDMIEAACRDIFKPPFDIDKCLEALRARLEITFDKDQNVRRLRAENRRLALAIVGFVGQNTAEGEFVGGPFYAEISNFDDLGAAADRRGFDLKGGYVPTMVGFVGHISALDDVDLRVLGGLADRAAPIEVVIEKVVDTMRRAAVRSGGTIGTEITSVVLKPGAGPTCRSHFLVPGAVMTPAFVMAWPDGRSTWANGMAIGNSQGTYESRDPMHLPMFERGRPCPCGSGAKYRNCHGRHRLNS